MLIGNRAIDSRYEILKLLTTGGMSSQIYLALDRKLNRQWAIKKVRKDSSETSAMLMAEADIMKSLDHPMLPRIVGIEEDRDYFYIIMDFIQGENLKTVLKAEGPQDQDTVVLWGIRLCDVLSYLHSKGIIYRDMKPANIMLTPDGNIKLIDFGIAREYKEGASEDTTALGTEGYAAPEQYEGQGGQTDARTDVYGMGITLFQLLTNVNPATYKENIFSIRVLNPSLSSGLDKIILKATNRDPDKRFQTAAEMKTALINYRKLDDKYIRKKRAVIQKFAVLAGMSALCFALAAMSGLALHFEKSRNYEALTTGSPTRENIEKAIDLKPDRPEAYSLLLSSYDPVVSPGELTDFSHVYGEHEGKMNGKSKAEISMIAGEKILMNYEDTSVRGRLLAAEPFFRAVIDNGKKDDPNYTAAECYVDMAKFYKDYVLQSDSVMIHEATRKNYEELLAKMNKVLSSAEKYQGSEQKSLVLSVDTLCLGIINEQADTMHEQGIDKGEILGVINRIEKNAEQMNPRIKTLQTRKSEVLETAAAVKSNIDNSYIVKKEEK